MAPALDADARAAIEDFLLDYAHTIDDGELQSWPDRFTEDGVYIITTRENFDAGLPLGILLCEGRGMMADRIKAMQTANIFEPHTYCHMTSALKIMGSDGNEHRTQSNFTIIRTMSEGAMSIFACGKYIDRIVEDRGDLKFRERSIILDSRRIDTLLVIPI